MTYTDLVDPLARVLYERYSDAAKVHMDPWLLLPDANRALWRACVTPNLAIRLEDAAKLSYLRHNRALGRGGTWETLSALERAAWRSTVAPLLMMEVDP